MSSAGKRKEPPEQLYADSRRASGKRYRQKRDPNAWSSSILTIRSNILLLGMSYPSVSKAIEQFNLSSKVHIQHPEPSVEQAIELVRRRILGTIDGRDYARIKALEASNEMLAFTVSKEKGGPYEKKRHLDADFNRRTFIKEMSLQWGVGFGCSPIQFKQVILDYYWIPPGTWQTMHWKPSFFRDNLPNIVHEGMLFYGCLSKDVRHIHTSNNIEGGDYITSDSGVIYLPFCENCFVEVVACSNVLSKVFTISFMRKDELEEHTLWKATNTISAASMQDWLEKKLDQEEEYCKLTRQKLAYGSAIGSNHVDRDAVLNIFERIHKVHDVRMIKLTALRNNHPEFKQCGITWSSKRGVSVGGFVGLLRSPPPVKLLPAVPAKKHTRKKAAPRGKAALPSEAEVESFLNRIVSLIFEHEDAIELSDSGALKIKRLDFLDENITIHCGGLEKELRRHGWKRRHKQVWYHSELQSAQIQSLLDARNAETVKTKKQSPIVQTAHTELQLTNDDANNSGIVLSHTKSSVYREILFDEFRSMAENHNRDEESAHKVLQKVNHLSAGSFFQWNHNKQIFYAVSEEEALKKIKNDIAKRNKRELKHQWMSSSTPTRLSLHRRHSPRFQKLSDSSHIHQGRTNESSGKMPCRDSRNGLGVILDYSNTLYEAVMFQHFHIMADKKLNERVVAKMVLSTLKEVASGSSQSQKEDNDTAISSKLYIWSNRQRNTHSATDEEALKKILSDISRRNEVEIASKWDSYSSSNPNKSHLSFRSNSSSLPCVGQNPIIRGRNNYGTVVSQNKVSDVLIKKDCKKRQGIEQSVPINSTQRKSPKHGLFEGISVESSTPINTTSALRQNKHNINKLFSSPTPNPLNTELGHVDQSRSSKYMLRKRKCSYNLFDSGKKTHESNKNKASSGEAEFFRVTNSFTDAMSDSFFVKADGMLSAGETSQSSTLSSDDSDMSSCRVDSDTYATTASSEPPLPVEANGVGVAKRSLPSENNSLDLVSQIESDSCNSVPSSEQKVCRIIETTFLTKNVNGLSPQAVAVYGIGCSNMKLFR